MSLIVTLIGEVASKLCALAFAADDFFDAAKWDATSAITAIVVVAFLSWAAGFAQGIGQDSDSCGPN